MLSIRVVFILLWPACNENQKENLFVFVGMQGWGVVVAVPMACSIYISSLFLGGQDGGSGQRLFKIFVICLSMLHSMQHKVMCASWHKADGTMSKRRNCKVLLIVSHVCVCICM